MLKKQIVNTFVKRITIDRTLYVEISLNLLELLKGESHRNESGGGLSARGQN